MQIRPAELSDAEDILKLTKIAFKVYHDALRTNVALSALKETIEDVKNDIKNNLVYIAEEEGIILGSIRVEQLSSDLAYIYRFSVNPDESSGGIGSELLTRAVNECIKRGFSAIALHTNSKYFKLARYYYGKEFYVHSTTTDRGYIRALFIKDLKDKPVDLAPALSH